MHDIRVAFRQFRKSPGFALTVILTIALGIGANTAIFTLVHAVLMKSLPVVDPKTLYRVGDKDDCCVNGGFLDDDGDFDLFSYELYRHLRDTTPEFEQLAAMQSGAEHDDRAARLGARQGAAQRVRVGKLLLDLWNWAVCRAHVDACGRHDGRGSGRRDELSGVALGLRWRSFDRGFDAVRSEAADDGGGNCAAGILWRPDSRESTGLVDSARHRAGD